MFRYEMLILASPDITKDEESNLEKNIDKLINNAKGSIITFDRWGKYRLAYPVRGNDYGVYFLMRFDVEDKKILKELDSMFYVKFNTIVMRNISTKLTNEQSLEYTKPPSLEDTPKKPIGFLQEKELKPRGFSAPEKKEEIKEVEAEEMEEEVTEKIEPKIDEKKEEVTKMVSSDEPKEPKELPETSDDIEKQEV